MHTALYNKTIQVAEATGLPVFIVDKSTQNGNSFGEKLASAMNVVFTRNFKSVIAIGNDCPQLSTEILLKTAGELNHRDLVLGPDRNSGVYLIGISATLFDETIISTISWQTKNVFSSLLKLSTDPTILDQLSDFNKLSDYYFFKNILDSLHGFIKLITAIISGDNVRRFSILTALYHSRKLRIQLLRAPPACC